MVALKVESNPIIKYPNSTNQAYYFYVFSMEGRWNVWNPWYLMPKNKQVKWNASFAKMSFHTTRIDHSSIWAINIMVLGELELQCVQGHSHG
jgi:hypothetical protein